MPNQPDGRELIADFFAALELKNLNQCENALAQLRDLARQRPAYAPWCDYLQGILVNERDRDWAQAERIFRRLLRTDLSPPLRARVLLALGRTYEYLGQWEDAIQAYEEALSVFTDLEQPVDQAKAWKHMAITHRRGFTQGDFGADALRQAIDYCQRALGALEPIQNPPSDVAWLEGSIWNTLGLIHRILQQWDQAIECYRKDLAICRSLDDRFGVGLSYGNLGEIYQKRGQGSWSQALEAYRNALTIIRQFDDRYEETEVLANLGFLHQEMGEYGVALNYYDQAIALIEELRAGLSSEEARAGFFATIADTYANAVLLRVNVGDYREAFNLVEQARSRAFLDALAARSTALAREMAAPTLSLAEVQAALPDDALLLEYFTTGLVEAQDVHRSTSQGPERHRFPPAHTLLFAVTADAIQVHDLGLSPNALRPGRLDNAAERHFLQHQIRETLYDRLIDPVAHRLQDKRRLYLTPHGPLHYVPFQALLAPDGETLLRDDGPRLIYAPSATLLFSRPVGDVSRPQSDDTCLTLGYNSDGVAPMRFAEEEAQRVAQLLGGHALTGPAPKKEAFFARAGDYRLLHLSCHGTFDPEAPLASSLRLAADETLTAMEVVERLRLRCDLVTLSACESGLSRVRRGDELIGLVRAFLHAGAPSLIVTLWRVDERSTLILMERFYQEVQAGVDFAEALRRAQLYVRNLTRAEVSERLENGGWRMENEEWRMENGDGASDDERVFSNPYYWAPFVLIGKG